MDESSRSRQSEQSPSLVTALRGLRRAREDRVVAGVCSGLGRELRVDPVVLRILLVVLSVFGGVGLLLYGAAWLLIPEEGEDASILEQQLGRRSDGTRDNAVVMGAIVVLAIIVISIPMWGLPWQVPALLTFSILGFLYLVRRSTDDGASPPGGATPRSDLQGPPSGAEATPAAPTSENASGQPHSAQSAPSGEATSGTPAAETDAETTEETAQLGSWRNREPAPPSFWDQPDPLGLESVPETPDTDDEWMSGSTPGGDKPSRNFPLFALTMAAALLAVGILAAVDASGSHIPIGAYVATPLAVVGLGLIVGTWCGRTAALSGVGILLALALAPVSALDHWKDSVADVSLRPTSVAELSQLRYQYNIADIMLDLRQVPFTDKDDQSVKVDVGVGEVTVVVPPDVDVTVTGNVGVGDMALLGSQSRDVQVHEGREENESETERAPRWVDRQRDSRGGFGVHERTTDYGKDGRGGGHLTLDVNIGVGTLEVRRGS
ncbi:MAG TPA: PspC domain-containing protein [Actinopolymorphaceae bacterium]